MRYSAEHKQQTRDRVLAVAAQEIREHGPDRISVASVMGKAGLTHGGFYAHFPSKEALIVAGIQHMFEQTNVRIDEVRQGKELRGALRDYIDLYLSEYVCEGVGRGCPIAALGSDLPRMDEQIRRAFAEGVTSQHQRILALFKALGVADPETAACSFRSEMLGALLSARLVSKKERVVVLDASKQSLKQRFGLE